MERHDIEAELALAGVKDLLDSSSMGHLAYVAKDGSPRVIPVGYYWTGAEFVISTASIAPKVAALTARPDVALTIDAGGRPEQARSLSIRGRVTITIVDGLTEEYVANARRSMDPASAAEFEKNSLAMYDQMARIAITPTWVRYYDFGGGRMPRFLEELAARNRG